MPRSYERFIGTFYTENRRGIKLPIIHSTR